MPDSDLLSAVLGPAAPPPPPLDSDLVGAVLGPVPKGKTGLVANVGAGAADASAGTLNLMATPVGTLIGRPLAIAGLAAHDALASTFGYEKYTPKIRAMLLDDGPEFGTQAVNSLLRAGGAATPDQIEPDGALQRMARAATTGAFGNAAFGGSGQLSWAGALGAGVAALGGATGGVAGQMASEMAPDEYKALAGLAGNVIGAGAVQGTGSLIGSGWQGATEFAQPMLGRKNPLLDEAGLPFIGSDGQPLHGTPYQQAEAGRQLTAGTANPDAVQKLLANPREPIVPGSNPTTAQATRDTGIGMQEFTAAQTGTDLQKAAFRDRADAQNDARVKLLQGQAAEGDVGVADKTLQAHADAADATHAADVARVQGATGAEVAAIEAQGRQQVATLQDEAGAANRAMGGNLPAGQEAVVGRALREPVAASKAADKVGISALYDAIDPEGTSAVSIAPLQAARASLAAEGTELSGKSGGASPKEEDIIERLKAAPEVVSMRALTELKKELTSTIRGADRDPERANEARRLTVLLRGVHAAMGEAAGRADLAGSPPANAIRETIRANPEGKAVVAPNVGGDVFTNSGQKVGVDYQLVDADSVTASHHDDMRPNAAFPQELQPRQRERDGSEFQVNDIHQNLIPEKLGASSSATDGAPIVGPDGLVESGNGRVLALRRVLKANGPQAAAYRQWLASQGHNAGPNDILIRRRTTAMTHPERVAFTGEGSTPSVMPMSAPERGVGDAKKLNDQVLQSLQPGPVTGDQNLAFVRQYAQHVVERNQHGNFVTGDGALSKEGALRVQAALVQKAYGDAALTKALTETTDPTARVLAGAMQDAAGPMARLRAGIDAGVVDKGVDLAPALVDAVGVIHQARTRGISLAAAVAQQDAFNQLSPLATKVLQAAYGEQLSGHMSAGKMSDLLAEYAKRAEAQSASDDMFAPKQTASQLLADVAARYGKDVVAGPAVADAAAAAAAAVEPAAAAPAAGAADPRILARPKLVENLSPETRARQAAADAAHAQQVATYRTAPGVGEMLKRGPGGYAASDAAVPAIIVKPGPAGRGVVEAFLAAGGRPEALTEAAAYSLRQYARRADGTLDPARVGSWAKDRSSFLSTLPAVAEAFGRAAEAQRAVEAGVQGAEAALKAATKIATATVNDAMVKRADAAKAMQNSAIGKVLGPGDTVAQLWTLLTSKTLARQHMAELVAAVKHDPAALAGLRRGVAAAIERNLVSMAKGASSTEGALTNYKMGTFMRHAAPALREVLSGEELANLHRIAADLEQNSFSSQVRSGSATAQLTAGRNEGLVGRALDKAVSGPSGSSLGAGVGLWIAGPAGAVGGGTLGYAVGHLLQNAREAGIQNVADLRIEGLLNPGVYKLLTAKVTETNKVSLVNALAAHLGRLSLAGAMGGQSSERRQISAGTPRNALLH